MKETTAIDVRDEQRRLKLIKFGQHALAWKPETGLAEKNKPRGHCTLEPNVCFKKTETKRSSKVCYT